MQWREARGASYQKVRRDSWIETRPARLCHPQERRTGQEHARKVPVIRKPPRRRPRRTAARREQRVYVREANSRFAMMMLSRYRHARGCRAIHACPPSLPSSACEGGEGGGPYVARIEGSEIQETLINTAMPSPVLLTLNRGYDVR